jgi:hypothetical protein
MRIGEFWDLKNESKKRKRLKQRIEREFRTGGMKELRNSMT